MESGREVVENCIFSKRWQLFVALNALPQPCHLPSRAEHPDVSSAPAEDSGGVGGSACPPGAQAH